MRLIMIFIKWISGCWAGLFSGIVIGAVIAAILLCAICIGNLYLIETYFIVGTGVEKLGERAQFENTVLQAIGATLNIKTSLIPVSIIGVITGVFWWFTVWIVVAWLLGKKEAEEGSS